MPRKPLKKRRDEPSASKDTAGKMADAVSYLCRVAAEEGFLGVLPDLFEAQLKLEQLATEGELPSKKRG